MSHVNGEIRARNVRNTSLRVTTLMEQMVEQFECTLLPSSSYNPMKEQELDNGMRHEGKITRWNDDKGFGFITPKDGGEQVFVYIKAFTSRSRRPIGNEAVTFELKADAKGYV